MSKFKNYIFASALILLIVLAFVFGSSFRKRGNNSDQTSVENKLPTMEELLGKKWDGYATVDNSGDPSSPLLNLKLVSDGVVIRDPEEILTKNGEILATAEASFRGYYYDENGNKQSVLVPVWMHLPDGSYFHPSFITSVPWSQAELNEKISSSPEFFGAKPGMVVEVGQIMKLPADYSTWINTGNIQDVVIPLIGKYNQSWQAELQKFWVTGDPGIRVIFPFNLANQASQQYVEDNLSN